MKLFKVFKKNRKSNNGNVKWRIGKWNHHKGKLELCKSGFHASEIIIDAMQYTNAEEIALVEIGEDFIKGDDKYVCRDMRVLKTWKWTKKDSVSLAIFAAELVLDNFEKRYPTDKRPREAIEAAKKVLKKDTKANRSAAWSAARSARSAAGSAARSARSAAWSAARSVWSVAGSAESAARSAARSAESAAGSAARSAESAVYDKCEAYIHKRLGIDE